MTFLPATRLYKGATVRVSTCGEYRIVTRRAHSVCEPQVSVPGDGWCRVDLDEQGHTFREAVRACKKLDASRAVVSK